MERDQNYITSDKFVKTDIKSFLLNLSVDLDTGAHGGSSGAGTDVLTLCSSGLSLVDSADESIIVLGQLLGAEGHLANGAVDDVGLIETILDLTSLD